MLAERRSVPARAPQQELQLELEQLSFALFQLEPCALSF